MILITEKNKIYITSQNVRHIHLELVVEICFKGSVNGEVNAYVDIYFGICF